MPRIGQMVDSKFLKKEDVGEVGKLATITNIAQYNVAKEGAAEELKWCLEFAEFDKPLVLNKTNMQLLEKITGSDNSDDWMGWKVVLYEDPGVSFGGEIKGGIRIRAARGKAAASVQPAKSQAAPNIPQQSNVPIEGEEEVPF